MWLVVWLAGCSADTWQLGDRTIALSRDGALHAEHPQGASIDGLRFTSGTGSAVITSQLGSTRFDEVEATLSESAGFGKVRDDVHSLVFPVVDDSGATLLLDASARVEVDLCASGSRYGMTAWQGAPLRLALYAAADPVGVLSAYSDDVGRPALPPPWVFGPWNDAIRGADRVREGAY